MLGREHWLQRARAAREVAGWIRSPEAKHLLMEIAERYEKIADIPGTEVLHVLEPKEADDAQGS